MNSISDKLIKILSLGIGLAIGIVLVAKVCFELSYDSFYKDVDRIYMITENIIFQEGGDPDDYWGTSGGIAPGFKAEVPGVEAATRYSNLLNGNLYDENDNLITGLCIGADTYFFDFFCKFSVILRLDFIEDIETNIIKAIPENISISPQIR